MCSVLSHMQLVLHPGLGRVDVVTVTFWKGKSWNFTYENFAPRKENELLVKFTCVILCSPNFKFEMLIISSNLCMCNTVIKGVTTCAS